MTARTISVMHYHQHIGSGKARSQWMIVYEAIVANPGLTRSQLEQQTCIRLSSVCGRVKELLQAEMVCELEELVICPVTGKRVHALVPFADEHAQRELVFAA